MPNHIPVPRASAQAFEAHRGSKPQNPGLIFDRFAPDWKGDDGAKKRGLEIVRAAATRTDTALLAAWNQRWEQAARAVHAQFFGLRTDWRLIAGLGRKGPLEVGFTFHRYGFPVLPGSSVKGIARAYAQLVEGQDESYADFVAIFGRAPKPGEDEHVARCGGAIFFDAIPATPPTLDLDIINPHYPDYYQGTAPPANWQSPVPVYFLTVAPDSEFRFAVGWRGQPDAEGERLRQLAQDWLVQGLVQLGAGAKTSAGYGYFVATGAGQLASVSVAPAVAERAAPSTPGAPAAPDSATAAPKAESAAPVSVRQGVVLEIRPDKGMGRLRDDVDGREYRFSTRVCRGNMPGKRNPVVFELQNGQVVSIRRL